MKARVQYIWEGREREAAPASQNSRETYATKEMEGDNSKGTVCVTGGTGFLASWLIFRLLEHGYSVNATVRSSPDRKKNISYLTDLPGASERLRIFNADLNKPDSFDAAIEGCVGVFHVCHPMDLDGREAVEEITRKAVSGTLGILQACVKAKTVKRVVYTSSIAAVMWDNKGEDLVDESTWSDVDYLRSSSRYGATYSISKTLTEKACIEFAEKNNLNLVTVLPSWIHGPFICPNVPVLVRKAMAMIFGDQHFIDLWNFPFVHTDDVARAHIFLFDHPDAKGRYLCSALEITFDKLPEFVSARYPEYQIQFPDSWKEIKRSKDPTFSSKKLLDIGFEYKYGLEEMYDDAIRCCKEIGLL